MSKHHTAYHKAIRQNRVHLSTHEKLLSKVIHQRFVELVLACLERSFFRVLPMQFGFIAVTTIGSFSIFVSYFYGYQTTSLTALGYLFALGFLVGVVYEYVRAIVKQAN